MIPIPTTLQRLGREAWIFFNAIKRYLVGEVSIEEFGAKPGGKVDCYVAIQRGIDSGSPLVIPKGKIYRISQNLNVSSNAFIRGGGMDSIIQPDAGVDGIIVKGRSNTLKDFKVSGLSTAIAGKGIILRGEDTSCVWNRLTNMEIDYTETGLYLDGYDDTSKPNYWNTFTSILVRRFTKHGVWLTKGDNGASAVTITGATAANPVSIEAEAHGFVSGTRVHIRQVGGMTELNHVSSFVITVVDADNFTLNGIDGSAYTAYTSGGQVYRVGDSPNRNQFYDLNIYSQGQAFAASGTYAGLYLEHSRFQNTFNGTHIALGTDALECVMVGGDWGVTDDTVLINTYTETSGVVTNVHLYPGSVDTKIINLQPYSAGSAIFDESVGSSYETYQAGFPASMKVGTGAVDKLFTGHLVFHFDRTGYPQTTTYEHLYKNTTPTTEQGRGDIIWNSAPQTNYNLGWGCYTAGTPGSFYRVGDMYIDGERNTVNPPSIADGSSWSQSYSGYTGAELGDFVEASCSIDLQGLALSAYVDSSTNITILLVNNTGAAVDLGSCDFKLRIRKKHTNPGVA